MVQKISIVSVKIGKGNTWKGVAFFPENFYWDQSFHLNSPWNYWVFHTNGKRSGFRQTSHMAENTSFSEEIKIRSQIVTVNESVFLE